MALAHPATLTHFNNHPTGICRRCHPQWIRWEYGCSVHRGRLDAQGGCYWCQQERQTGVPVPPQDISTTHGYPGDDAMR